METARVTRQGYWNPLHIQATYFLSDAVQPISLDFLGELQRMFMPRQEGSPIVIPFPPEMPPDVPRAVLRTDDDAVRVEVALNRTNVHFFHPKGARLGSTPDVEIYAKLGERIGDLIERTKLPVNRLAAVSEFFHPLADEPPGLFIAQHFFKPEFLRAPFNRPSVLEVHSHKIFMLDRFNVNSWVRVKNILFEVPPEGLGANAIVFQSDINTLAEEPRDFTSIEIKTFFALLGAEVRKVRSLYFPGAGD